MHLGRGFYFKVSEVWQYISNASPLEHQVPVHQHDQHFTDSTSSYNSWKNFSRQVLVFLLHHGRKHSLEKSCDLSKFAENKSQSQLLLLTCKITSVLYTGNRKWSYNLTLTLEYQQPPPVIPLATTLFPQQANHHFKSKLYKYMWYII